MILATWCIEASDSDVKIIWKQAEKKIEALDLAFTPPENNNLLGTGGAIRNSLHLLTDDFFVLYGDSWLEIDYRSVYESFQNSGKTALMTVYCNEGRWDTSNVEMDGNHIIFYSKTKRNPRNPHFVYPLRLLKQKIFDHQTTGANYDLADF